MNNKKGSKLVGIALLCVFFCFAVQAGSKNIDYSYLIGDDSPSYGKHQ